MIRRWTPGRPAASLLLLQLFAASACTPGGDAAPGEDDVLLPGGYEVVLDTGRSDPGHFAVTREDAYLEVMTGPGGIAWRPADTVHTGDFLAEATLTVIGAPVGYREGYGIFVGGRELRGRDTRYTYLLVRPDGDYLIKQHRPDGFEVLKDWTRSSAVQQVTDTDPQPINVLGILTEGEEVRFLVNGTVVETLPRDAVSPYGVAGLRINHRLDVRVPAWYLGAPPLETGS